MRRSADALADSLVRESRRREAFGVRAYSAAFRLVKGVADDSQVVRERKAAESARTPKASPDSPALTAPHRCTRNTRTKASALRPGWGPGCTLHSTILALARATPD